MCSSQWSESGQPNLAFDLVIVLVKLGQHWSNLSKPHEMRSGHVLRTFWCIWDTLGSHLAQSSGLVLRANMRGYLKGKNRVMIVPQVSYKHIPESCAIPIFNYSRSLEANNGWEWHHHELDVHTNRRIYEGHELKNAKARRDPPEVANN